MDTLNITAASVSGMDASDREIYFAHMAKRHAEEKVLVDDERARQRAYREMLAREIEARGACRISFRDLLQYSTRMLERLHDNI